MNPDDELERMLVTYLRIPPAALVTSADLARVFAVGVDQIERALTVLCGLDVLVAVGSGPRPRYALRWGATAPWETPAAAEL